MVLYEYVGKMLRKEGKIVVENVKKAIERSTFLIGFANKCKNSYNTDERLVWHQ